jgi:uncharacterized protein YqgQ
MTNNEASANDAAQREKVKNIVQVLANAVSAAKLFPSDHQSVVNFISDLHERLTTYLDECRKLELGVEEFAFTWEGERVYEDPYPIKSLPFFFYKDGMQRLYFYQGLSREEVGEFLETIREVSKLPPEEGDIVTSLWEQDCANIRYLAPDQFLETKIGVGRRPLRPTVDRSSLSQGRVELTPEDLEEVKSRILALQQTPGGGTAAPLDSASRHPAEKAGSSEEDEIRQIDALLRSRRQASAEDEYLNLVVELIYLEDRPDQFTAIVDVLEQYRQEIMAKADYAKAAVMMRTLSEIRDRLAKKDKRKSELIGSVISLLSRKSVLVELQGTLDLNSLPDLDGLFSYLKLFGPQSAGLLAEIYEQTKATEWRQRALGMLKEIGQVDVQELGKLIRDSWPALSQEIIGILRESRDSRVVPLLANVVGYKNPAIKQAAIRALGKFPDGAADRIILGFLSDENESVRTAALDSLKKGGDPKIVHHVIGLISGKDFAGKSDREKQALFNFLARSDSEEAAAFLARILKKVPFWPNPKHTELCLYAVSALAGMTRPIALELLRAGGKRRNLKIRNACLKALQSRAEIPITFTGRMPQ